MVLGLRAEGSIPVVPRLRGSMRSDNPQQPAASLKGGKEGRMGLAARQVVFLFQEGGGCTKEEAGGKAFGLVEMTLMGLPVPPGFFITTGVCRAFLEHGSFPVRLDGQLERCIKALEQQTGKRFGGRHRPLLVSVRSGAPASMPGMMDTVLNLGLTSQSIPALARWGGERFAADTWARFEARFQKVVGCAVPGDPRLQLRLALEAVCRSWRSLRACEYRKSEGIPEQSGTAMAVQAMVFGNFCESSGTGVAFSRNVATGDPVLYGEYLSQAQGEDVVGGGVTPLPISVLAERNPQVYRDLADWVGVLESNHGDVVEIEYTIEAGRLWFLQVRSAKRTPRAAARFAVQSVWEARATKAEAVACVSEQTADALGRPEFEKEALALAAGNGQFFARGLAAAPGAVVGNAVFTPEMAKEMAVKGGRPVLFRQDTSPDDLAGMMASVALVTATGGATSHAAVVARAQGIPAVVGLTGVAINGRAESGSRTINEGDLVSIDGASGTVLMGSVPLVASVHAKEISIFLKWAAELRPPKPRPRPDFGAIEKRVSANTLLNDFYLADAMASAAVSTKFETEAKELRRQVVEEVARLLLTYLFVAVAGELRHAPKRDQDEAFKSNMKVLSDKFGLLWGREHLECQLSVIEKLKNCSAEEQIEFFRLAEAVFSVDSWPSSYGGAKWVAIAAAPRMFLDCQLEAAVFVDHTFDLRHNGGRLFDKHSMVTAKTNEGRLHEQLDLKKKAVTIEALEQGLRQLWNEFSPLVSDLFTKGRGTVWCRPEVKK